VPSLSPTQFPSLWPTAAPTQAPSTRPTAPPTRAPTFNPFAPRVVTSSAAAGPTTIDVALTTDDPAYVQCYASPAADQGWDLCPLPTVPFNASAAKAVAWRFRARGLVEGVLYELSCTTRDDLNRSAIYALPTTRTSDLHPPDVLGLGLLPEPRLTGLALQLRLSEPGRVTCRALAAPGGRAAEAVEPPAPSGLLGRPSTSTSRAAGLEVAQAHGNYTLELGGLEPGRNFSVFCYATDK
jgi:hypothetical protein